MPEEKKQKFAYYFYNIITYIGATLAFFVLGCEVLLFGLDFFSGKTNVYLGILTYILLPPFLVLGLLLIPIGARWKYKQVLNKKVEAKPKLLNIDPGKTAHRNAFIVFLVGTTIFLIMTMIGSYKAFHYTESVEFCGTTCHEPMKPEYTAYLQSAHGRVKCVDCHIGEGADYYLRSKIAGTRQMLKSFSTSYDRPIPTPVHALRPAKEICEKCHWPGKYFYSLEIKRTYFGDGPVDGKTPRWKLQMMMPVGGKENENLGIHAHMYNNNDIYYAADDAQRQKISWVKSVSKSGETNVYTTENSAYKNTEPPAEKIKKMDCIDCHSRPSHHFEAPMPLVNKAMEENKINPEIPSIKSKAVEVLSKNYATEQEAAAKIRSAILEYYAKKQAEYYAGHQKEINDAIEAIIWIYRHNFFPEMKTRWDTHPENIGHMIFPGCFRCHDEEHKTAQGKTISRDCAICHTITAQGPADNVQKSLDGLPFQHPFEDDGSWKTMNCVDCHTGGD